MRHPCSFLDYIDFSVDLSELIKIYHEKNICYKIHKILMERVKKLLTVRDRRDIVIDTCEQGLFSAARIRCPGADPSACGTQGGSSRTSTVPSGRVFAPFGAGSRL